MGIAITLAKYLVDQGIAYDLVPHPYTATASESAAASQVAADSLAKAVVLKGGDGFMLAVLPASRHIHFTELRHLLGSDVDMANEEQVETPFIDCEPGAVPALGAAYGLNVAVDVASRSSATSISKAATTLIWSISAGRAFRS